MSVHPRFDAPTNLFADQALTHVRQQTYDVKLPLTKFREFIPVGHDVPPGAEAVAYYQIDVVGSAKLVKSYADQIQAVDAHANKFTRQVVGLMTKYAYSFQELRAAALAQSTGGLAGMALDVRKANAARTFMERLHNKIAATGVAEIPGFEGLTNHSQIPIVAGLTGAWSNPATDPDSIVADIAKAVANVNTVTEENHVANALIVPTQKLADLRSRRLGDGSDTTILQYIRNNFPELTVIGSWNVFKGAGVGVVDRFMVGDFSPEVLEYVIPQEFEQLDPEKNAAMWEVICHSRSAGLEVRYPKALAYGDGI